MWYAVAFQSLRCAAAAARCCECPIDRAIGADALAGLEDHRTFRCRGVLHSPHTYSVCAPDVVFILAVVFVLAVVYILDVVFAVDVVIVVVLVRAVDLMMNRKLGMWRQTPS